MPSQVKSTLSFYLAEKLPKGDKILDALYNHLETLFTGSESKPQPGPGSGPFPPAICAIQRLGFGLSDKDVEFSFYGLNIDGGPSSLELAVRRSASYSGRAEAARATLEQVKMEDIDTNVAVLKVCF